MVRVQNVSKIFHDQRLPLKVLDGISFEIKKDEFVSVFGPNGCGKTTLLKMFWGLESPTAGNIAAGGRDISQVKCGAVFQDYRGSLYPWRTVEQNIALALEGRDVSKEGMTRTVNETIDRLKLGEHRFKYPYQLSGGLSQLVSIGRAFALDPEIFVLDEPFSALDYETSFKMQQKFLEIWESKKRPVLFVSHSPEEAIFLSDKIVVFSRAPAKVLKIIEVDLPRPRSVEQLSSPGFLRIKSDILNFFKGYLSS